MNQLPIDLKRIEQSGGKVVMHKTPETILEKNNLKFLVSGEIKRTHEEEQFSKFLINRDGIIKNDEILDDKCLIIELETSVILLNGCCHSGIMNTLDYVKELTDKPISHIIGGFHMANSTPERIKATMNYLRDFQEENLILFPIHCSGNNFVKNVNAINAPNIKAFNASVGTAFNFSF
ncbi:MAG: hypothetical protein EU517_00670 [Promethearchaeota archaeon]|nr:MAG: hypothetical protein EU517_00670 [Candidatus Lokiarchaeota archaeon]